MSKQFTIPAVIHKADIRIAAAHYERVNLTTFEDRAPGTVQFKGFVGVLHLDDGLYHGAHHFSVVAVDPKNQTAELNQLPGLKGASDGV